MEYRTFPMTRTLHATRVVHWLELAESRPVTDFAQLQLFLWKRCEIDNSSIDQLRGHPFEAAHPVL